LYICGCLPIWQAKSVVFHGAAVDSNFLRRGKLRGNKLAALVSEVFMQSLDMAK
jgi:hypothetical protein